MTDKLYDEPVKHWTRKEFPLVGAIRVDGKTYRFMGVEEPASKTIAAISTDRAWAGSYQFDDPGEGWEQPDFDDSKWKIGQASFGTPDETNVSTVWQTPDIWVRRHFQIDEDLFHKKVFLRYSHDDTFELYVNGILVVKTGYEWHKNVIIELSDEVKNTLKKGQAVIAAHCNNKTGGGLVDFGIYAEDTIETRLVETAVQQSVDVQATQTHYTFECGRVELKLSFMAPLLLDNLNLISRPVNYIYYTARSLDGKSHDVQVYFEAARNWALNTPSQENTGVGYEKDNLILLKTGSTTQKILGKRGDDIRIDWGYFYLCSEKSNSFYQTGDPRTLRHQFAHTGRLLGGADTKKEASLAISQSLGNGKFASGKIMVGYDDIYSMQYFRENLRPYWNKDGNKTIEKVFAEADQEFDSLRDRCTRFDYKLMLDAWDIGGKEYAELCALAYRQTISAHKLMESPEGDLLFLSKENDSNGSIATVDVTYASIPLFLYYNPSLAEGLLNPIFYYSESCKWVKLFPAHDIGTYPWANDQSYGGDMPVEEAGNMLIMTAAIAAAQGNAKYAEKHWDILTVWARYLVEKGLDPENQLCTDDFSGHLAHNANLSLKAIVAVACYGRIAEMLGKSKVAENYTQLAKQMAKSWMQMADDGLHYRLTFDQPGSWSLKYNLVWDIFPKEVAQKEIDWYLTQLNLYGVPLDSRQSYTKADWTIWTATLSDNPETFRKLVLPLHRFMNETTDRVPMTDWYFTDKKDRKGFSTRSVVGGYFIRMLERKLQ
jgi:hypothetical protein